MASDNRRASDQADEASQRGAAELVERRVLDDGSGQDYFVSLPKHFYAETPVVVLVHDISRDAEHQAKAFASACERYGAILLAPHFAADRYLNFQRLGRSRKETDHGKHADDALKAILKSFALTSGATVDKIHLVGFGAGGRFAIRYSLANPDSVAGVVAACADSFTFPDPEVRFPQGIGPGRKRDDLRFDPEAFLSVPMTVFETLPTEGHERGPRLESVGDESDAGRRSAVKWLAAMQESAVQHEMPSLVSHVQVGHMQSSFDALVAEGDLPARSLEALLGPVPGERARYADNHASGSGENGLIVVSDSREDFFEPEPSRPVTTLDRLRRVAVPALLAVAAIALLTPIFLWMQYRGSHVVSRDAVVRSHIADVGTRLDGVVKSVEVDTGDRVAAGQVVARLEASHYEAKVRQARSELEKTTRELEVERMAIENERERLDGTLREVSAGVSAAEAETLVSESRVEEALRRLELQQSLASQGLVAQERVRMAETELRTARAMSAASSAQQRAAGVGEELARVASDGIAVRERRISVIESDIDGYRAELALAEANLEGTIIRAPDDGAVVRRIVEPGGSAGVGQPIISLWVGEEIWVEAWLDEDDLSHVAVGSEATVTLTSYPDREFTGVIESLGVSTDVELPDSEVPQPRHERMRDAPVISVRIKLDEPEQDLFPGLSAIVAIRKQAD